MGVLSVRYCEPLVTRFGARRAVVSGLLLIAAGLALLSRAPEQASYPVDLLPAMVVLGTGAGVAFPALMALAMSAVGGADAGLASGVLNTTGQVGGALGLAVLATLAAGRTAALDSHGRSAAAALLGGYHLAFWVAAGMLVLAVGIGALVLERPAEPAEAAIQPVPESPSAIA
jgi:MFS family permease